MKKIFIFSILLPLINYQLVSQTLVFEKTNNFGTGISKCSDFADFDNDGDIDFVVGNLGESFIYINDGNGNFIDSISLSNSLTNIVKWIDLDNDNLLDLFVGNENSDCFIYYNQGDGSFLQNSLGFSLMCYGMDGADFDNDGDIDILITQHYDGFTLIFENDGNNNFTPNTFNDEVEALTTYVFDVDNDADLDIVFGYGCCIDSSEVYLNDGIGNYTLYSKFADTDTEIWNIDIGDINSDGFSDIAVSEGNYDEVNLYINDGTGIFTELFIDNVVMPSACFGDINNDGVLDLVVGSPGFESARLVYYINNNMTFEKVIVEEGSTTFPFNTISNIQVFDANNDNHNDIVALRYLFQSESETLPLQNSLFISEFSNTIIENNNVYSIFPNPTNELINIVFADTNIKKLTLYDITGKQIIEKKEVQLNEQINLSCFKSGIYIFNIQTDKEMFTTKIIKK